jgi:hypothetical protein
VCRVCPDLAAAFRAGVVTDPQGLVVDRESSVNARQRGGDPPSVGAGRRRVHWRERRWAWRSASQRSLFSEMIRREEAGLDRSITRFVPMSLCRLSGRMFGDRANEVQSELSDRTLVREQLDCCSSIGAQARGSSAPVALGLLTTVRVTISGASRIYAKARFARVPFTGSNGSCSY